MTDRYGTLLMNRAWIVYDNQTKQEIESFKSKDRAEAKADELNLNLWREQRPTSAEPFRWGATEADLLGMIEEIYEPERQLDLLSRSVTTA